MRFIFLHSTRELGTEMTTNHGKRGVAAALFGVSTPFSKLLLGRIDPLLLAGLLYLGSGLGLAVWIGVRWLLMRDNSREAGLQQRDLPWLGLAVLSGGIVAPVLLMFGLKLTPASSASLLLNLEGVLTALLAWFVFKENFDRRILTGIIAILGGGVLLSWEPQHELAVPWGALCICGASLVGRSTTTSPAKFPQPIRCTLRA
jgi:drug/metabolite transporter (DMT)-like permease